MERGAIYWVNFEPAAPPEFGKMRPAIVISNVEHNMRLPTVIVVPVSSKPPVLWPLRLSFKMPRGKTSYAILPGLRQVNKTRLHDMIGLVSNSFLKEMIEAVNAYLGE